MFLSRLLFFYRGGRRKRQAEGVDYKEIYNKVMANLSAKFSGDELTQTQKTEATQIITNTQVTEDSYVQL